MKYDRTKKKFSFKHRIRKPCLSYKYAIYPVSASGVFGSRGVAKIKGLWKRFRKHVIPNAIIKFTFAVCMRFRFTWSFRNWYLWIPMRNDHVKMKMQACRKCKFNCYVWYYLQVCLNIFFGAIKMFLGSSFFDNCTCEIPPICKDLNN